MRDVRHENVKIICNLTSGGTNPSVIETIPRHCIRHHEALHAKVYLGDDDAIVCSANASANGLGLEGQEQQAWKEAGCRTNEIIDIILWFNKLWEESAEITDELLAEAKRRWADRQRVKPSLNSFSDFDIRSGFFPLLYWEGRSDWRANEEAIIRQVGHFDENVQDRIGSGIQVRDPLDREILKPGTWVLCGKLTDKGTPSSRTGLNWVYIGKIIEDAVQLDGESVFEPVAPLAEKPPPEPFDVDDREFQAAFRKLIMNPKYEGLRDEKYIGPWFQPRQFLMKDFWFDLQKLVETAA